MKRSFCLIALAVLLLAAAAILLLPDPGYAQQDREAIMADPSPHHPTGTDALGRDRTVRTAAAVILGLAGATAASAATTTIAAAAGIFAAFAPALASSAAMIVVDLFLTLPWLFLLMMVRSGLPLNTSPLQSATITFVLLAALGWPACARAVFSGARTLRRSESMIYGRAAGLPTISLVRLYLLPHLHSLLLPQFLICIPAFIVAEANLGTLGLGIAEPLPSWGAMLQELNSSALLATSHWIFLPIVLLVVVLFLLEMLLTESSPLTEA